MGDDLSDDDRWLANAVETRRMGCLNVVNGMAERLDRIFTPGVR